MTRLAGRLVRALVAVTVATAVFGSSWAMASASAKSSSQSTPETITSATWGAAIGTSATVLPVAAPLSVPIALLGSSELIYLWNTGNVPLQSVTYTFTSSSPVNVATISSCSSLFTILLVCLGGTTTIGTSGVNAITSTLVPPVGGSQQLLLSVAGPLLGGTVTVSVSVSPSQVRPPTTTYS